MSQMTQINHEVLTTYKGMQKKAQTFFNFRRVIEHDPSTRQRGDEKTEIELKSLILAQIERWRHALHMQVERQHRELAL